MERFPSAIASPTALANDSSRPSGAANVRTAGPPLFAPQLLLKALVIPSTSSDVESGTPLIVGSPKGGPTGPGTMPSAGRVSQVTDSLQALSYSRIA
jgi:hypothetical protein